MKSLALFNNKAGVGATIWPVFEPLTSPDDPELWLATSYCPPVDLRIELLGVPESLAAQQLESCRARVAAARAAAARAAQP